MPFTDPIITRFSVDDRGYLQGLDRIGGGLKKVEKQTEQTDKGQQKLLSTFHDYKAAADTAIGVLKKLGGSFDAMITRSGRLQGMMRAQTVGIIEAQRAVGGLIDKATLLEAANRGVALGIDLSEEKFASLARAAAIVSQRMGTDVTQAIGDLMTGLGRQSAMILDNLGIIVKAEDAYKSYAAALGKTKAQLTGLEKRQAFQKAALAELERIAGKAQLQTDTLAGSWKGFKVQFSDALDRIAGGAGQVDTISFSFKFWGEQVRDLSYWLTGTNAQLEALWEKLRVARNQSFKFVAPKETSEEEWQKKLGVGKYTKGGKLRNRGDKFRGGGRGRKAPETTLHAFQRLTKDDAALPKLSMGDFGLEQSGGGMFAGMGDQLDTLADSLTRGHDGWEVYREAMAAAAVQAEATNMALEQMALQGLGNFAGGMWDAIDAAIAGEKSIGQAMTGLAAKTLLAVAQQATVKAVFELAEGFSKLGATWGVPNPGAAAHFTSAAKYGIAAGLAGGAGLGLSAASRSSGGSGSRRGVDRGVGGPSSSANRQAASATFVYNINTITPPDEDEAAAVIASSVNRARALGFLAAA